MQHRRRRQELPQSNLESLRCMGGPWHKQARLIATNESSLLVPGESRFRYVRVTTGSGQPFLAWSNDETRW